MKKVTACIWNIMVFHIIYQVIGSAWAAYELFRYKELRTSKRDTAITAAMSVGMLATYKIWKKRRK